MEILRSKELYSFDASSSTAAYDPEKLKILRRTGARPLVAADLVEAEVRQWLLEPDRYIVRSDDEILAIGERIVPLQGSHSECPR